MFEKEAEEIANKRCHEIMCFGHCSFSSPKHHRCGEWHREYNCAKDGAEFGYKLAHEEMDYLNKHWGSEEERKANEWHYVKDELPPEDVPLICVRGGKIYVAWYWDNIYHDSKCCQVKKPYAWKEIVLPKESE